MKTLLWLDDRRDPFSKTTDWLQYSPIGYDVHIIWIKGFHDFVDYIINNKMPDGICFDHDLGFPMQTSLRALGMSKKKSREVARKELSGADCAKWLVEYCLKENIEFPKWNVQSSNPIGKQNIINEIKDYEKLKKQ